MSAWHTPLPDPKIGDVIEIATAQGFAYAQFTHDIPLQCELLRILPGLYPSRPSNLDSLVRQRERYVTFFLLRNFLYSSRAGVAIVGHFEIPARNRPVPLFRSPALEPRELGPPPYWTLWDGERRWQVDRLTEAQRDLPVGGIPHREVFLDQIATGWSPRDYDGVPVARTPPETAGESQLRPQYRRAQLPEFELPPVAADESERRSRQRRLRHLARIGDVVEIGTPKGFVYVQLTHDLPMRGELVRVLPGFYATRPANLAALVRQRERYVTFSMLRGILRDNEVINVGGREVPEAAIVGPFPIPERNRPIPLFRMPGGPGRHPVTGRLNTWRFMDEDRLWRVEGLTAAQRDLPVEGIPSHPLFIEQIVSGWHPRGDAPHLVHFLSAMAAQVAARRLEDQGYLGTYVFPESGEKWVVVAYGERPPPAGLAEELAAQSAEELKAELVAAERAAQPAAAREPLPEHFLYFPTAAAAQEASRQLRAEGFKRVAARAPDSAYFEDEEAPPGTHALGREWSVVASGTVPPPGDPIEDTRKHLAAMANSLGGEYDG